jgi:hypothetical protein
MIPMWRASALQEPSHPLWTRKRMNGYQMRRIIRLAQVIVSLNIQGIFGSGVWLWQSIRSMHAHVATRLGAIVVLHRVDVQEY